MNAIKASVFLQLFGVKLHDEDVSGFSHLLGALTHDDAAALVILHGPVCFSHHLEDVVYGVIHITEEERDDAVNKAVTFF